MSIHPFPLLTPALKLTVSSHKTTFKAYPLCPIGTTRLPAESCPITVKKYPNSSID